MNTYTYGQKPMDDYMMMLRSRLARVLIRGASPYWYTKLQIILTNESNEKTLIQVTNKTAQQVILLEINNTQM